MAYTPASYPVNSFWTLATSTTQLGSELTMFPFPFEPATSLTPTTSCTTIMTPIPTLTTSTRLMASYEKSPGEEYSEALAIFGLVVYSLSLLPALFAMARHGKHGVIGWSHVFIFCLLRILSNAFQLDSQLEGCVPCSILTSIGPGILLLAIGGVLLEARHYHRRRPNPTFGWLASLFIHLLIFTGVGLIAAGFDISDPILVSIGMFIFLVGLIVITILSVVALAYSYYRKLACMRDNRTKLLCVIALTLPFLWIRVVVGCIWPFNIYGDLPLASIICLYVLPELLAVLIVIFGGLVTQNIKDTPTEQLAPEMTSGSLERNDLR